MSAPDLILFAEFGGNWDAYEQKLNEIFLGEIANAGLRFRGAEIRVRWLPKTEGKAASFWHLIQEGRVEDDRLPDFRRCERLRWVPWVINNATSHAEIDEWQNQRNGETNTLLWYREEYIVILGRRQGYWLLRSAYCTTQSRRVEQLRRERNEYRKVAAGKLKPPKSP